MPTQYPIEFLEDFYWAWEQSGRTITPDGKAWIDQDPVFWQELALFAQYQKWAEYEVEHPTRRVNDGIKAVEFSDL